MALRGTGKSGGATKQDAGSGALVSASTRFLILHGSERFLQDKYIADLRAAMTKAHGEGGFDTVRFDGMAGQRIIADVLDECRSMGLMAQFKVVLVDNADLLLKADDDEDGGSAPAPAARGKRTGPAVQGPRKLLEAYAADPSDNAALVLRAGNWRPGNLDKAVAALEDAGAVIKCESPSEEEAVGWAVKRATQSHATTLAPAAAQALVAAVGADLGRIDSELAKLALAAGGRGEPITEQLVSSMTGVTREDELWGIQSRVLSGDTAEALEYLHLLVDVTRADAVPLTWAYVDLARKVHTASRGLSQGLPRQQIMSSLKAWGPMLDLIINKATRLKPEVAARLLKDAVQTDSAGKSGQGDPVRNLELLTVKMCQAFGAPPAAPSHADRNARVAPSRSGGR